MALVSLHRPVRRKNLWVGGNQTLRIERVCPLLSLLVPRRGSVPVSRLSVESQRPSGKQCADEQRERERA